MTRITDRRRKSRIENEADELRERYDLMRAANEIAQQEDIKRRFGGYDEDISVGDMYQRKKKSKKAKTKRKTKGCGCK